MNMDVTTNPSNEPTIDRPRMPAGYGPTGHLEGALPWTWAQDRLVAARSYWIATVDPHGAPHVAPVWGVFVAGAVWFSTDPDSAKARNLARDPRVVVNLESGDEVVIVHGRVDVVTIEGGSFAREPLATVAETYADKYQDPETGEAIHLRDSPPGSLLFRVVPSRVLGWLEAEFPSTRTRWNFARAGNPSAEDNRGTAPGRGD